MKKAIVAASTALLLAGLTPAFAQADQKDSKPAVEKVERDRQQGPRFSAEDRAAFVAARLAALKAGLQLTSEQEPHWTALETALRGIADERAERLAERRAGRDEDDSEADSGERRERRDVLQVLSWQAEGLRARADNLTKVAEAAKPLYDSLNDAQKRRFGVLLRDALGGPGGPRHQR
ncbi:Spy/CpxP family protein refolding chaperone [Pseudochelatococcus lubricantis]|uniref:Spy/CpxP family protein refolding chaperone n=1 Tax=Pseudochelatococcus lubricantis TaxID=1538102 RepID=UPI0035E89A58